MVSWIIEKLVNWLISHLFCSSLKFTGCWSHLKYPARRNYFDFCNNALVKDILLRKYLCFWGEGCIVLLRSYSISIRWTEYDHSGSRGSCCKFVQKSAVLGVLSCNLNSFTILVLSLTVKSNIGYFQYNSWERRYTSLMNYVREHTLKLLISAGFNPCSWII